MAARSIGTGTVSFGMVSIPIRLYAAGESKSAVSFNLLHDKCKSRLKQQYVCPKDNEVVGRDHMVKGYEFTKDQYVSFTEDEIKQMAEETQKAIEITEFVPASEVDPVYFDGAYYLGPDQGGDKAYKLLSEAMKQTGRSALAKWSARGKQYLVMIRPVKNGLVMQQLLYADEVRPFSEVPVGDAELKDSEMKLAIQLVDQIASDQFKPENYSDEVKKRYQEAIQRKVDGQEVTAAPEAPRAQIIDLMEALKASLASKGSKPEAGGAAPAAKAEPEDEVATGTEGKTVKRSLRVASSRGPSRRSRNK
jgi:DNA end-binding protein Ku